MKKKLLMSLIMVLSLLLAVTVAFAGPWGWKKADDPNDALNFLNGQGAYESPPGLARVCQSWTRNGQEFYVFYQPSQSKPIASWAWKEATDPTDVQNFLSGTGAYSKAPEDALVTLSRKSSYSEYIVFYKINPSRPAVGNWGWKLATDPDDMLNFLNGIGAYKNSVNKVRICAQWKVNHLELYAFYETKPGPRSGGWGWKKATDPNDVQNFLSGKGAYKNPVRDAEICSVWERGHLEFYVFYR